MLVFGDSTDKLWHSEMCSGLLPAEQQCASQCITPDGAFLPNNLQPFVCAADDDRCARRTCYDTPQTPCWEGIEDRTAAACKPRDPAGSILAFAHLTDTDPNFDLESELIDCEANCSGALATSVGERVAGAVAAFAAFTSARSHRRVHEVRPIVVVIDVMFWWVGTRFQDFQGFEGIEQNRRKVPDNPDNPIKDPAYVEQHFDEILEQYRSGMLGLVDLVKEGCTLAGRACAVVGKPNHNPSLAEGSIELKLHLAMRDVLREMFDGTNDMYLFDWYAVSQGANNRGEWGMLDGMHQTAQASRVATVQFEAFTRGLPEGFAVNLTGGGGR